MVSFDKLDEKIQAQLSLLIFILIGLSVTLSPWLGINTKHLNIDKMPSFLKYFTSSLGLFVVLLGLVFYYKNDSQRKGDHDKGPRNEENIPMEQPNKFLETSEEIKCLFNPLDSANKVKQMYKDIEEYLSDKDINDIVIYDANLQTLKPHAVWEEDGKLVKIANEHNVEWYYLAGINAEKESFNKEWKKTIGWDELAKGYYKEIPVPDKEYPLPNLFSVPQLGQCYIGFGDCNSIGMKKDYKNKDNAKGGGIWINNRQASQAVANVIKALHELS